MLLFGVHAIAQPIVLSGYATIFTNPGVPENQEDPITSNVAITRGATGGIYNALVESGFPVQDPDAMSPQFTRWATDLIPANDGLTIAAANYDMLEFDTWLNAYGGLGGVGRNIVGRDAVVRIIRSDLGLEDVYIDIRFISWTVGGGGGFSYERATTPTGDYNGDGSVDAADYVVWRKTLGESVAAGEGADGNLSRAIDAGDYDFWRSRFGNVVSPGSGVGSPLAIPEPAACVLLLSGLLAYACRRNATVMRSRELGCKARDDQ